MQLRSVIIATCHGEQPLTKRTARRIRGSSPTVPKSFWKVLFALRGFRSWIPIAIAFAAGAVTARSEINTFREGVGGYSGTRDTFITSGSPTANNGGNVTSEIDQSGGGGEFALLRFESLFGTGAGQIPPKSKIISATLTLRFTNAGNDPTMHRMLVPWQEDSSWDSMVEGILADDVEAAATGDATFNAPAAEVVIDLPISTIQAWSDGTKPNYGWVFLPGGTDGADFSASEHTIPANRPLLTIVWGAAGEAIVKGFTSGPGAIEFRIEDAAAPATVNLSTISLTVDGTKVTPQVNKAGAITTVRYAPASFFASGSTHTATLSYSDSATPPKSKTVDQPFVMATYSTIVASTAVTGVDTTKAGFKARIHQIAAARGPGDQNSLANALSQLADGQIDPVTGQPYPNEADLTAAQGGVFNIEGIINWDQVPATRGNFSDASTPAFPDDPIPGIPGTGGGSDNIAADITTFLELKAGLHRFGVNSDDGFLLASGPAPQDILSTRLGLFDGGRGAADTIFDVAVEKDGIYPFRLVWWEGGGDANLEFFSVDTTTGEKIPVNHRTNAKAIKAYREGPVKPYLLSVKPPVNEIDVPLDATLELVLADQGTQVQTSSVKLSVNGQSVTPTVNKPAGSSRTTVTYKAAAGLSAGTKIAVKLEFSDNASPAAVNVREYSFSTKAATTFTFQEGVDDYTGTHDTFISSGSTSTERGDSETVQIDQTTAGGEFVLIRFENIFGTGPKQIRPGSKITSANLRLFITNTGNPPSLHRMLKPWEESDTWETLVDGVSADEVESAIAPDATFEGRGSPVLVTLPASTLQAWLDGTRPNYGWIIRPSGTDGTDFSSSENSNPANRPILRIEIQPAVTAPPPPPPPPPTSVVTLDVRVAGGLDDTEEHLTEANAIDITSSDLELGAEGGGGDIQLIGIRFRNITIPPGSTIKSAHIQFTVDEADDEPTSVRIFGERSANPVEYSTAASDVSKRARTTASVDWNNIPVWNAASIGSAGADQRTPDLTAVVQELIGQTSWSAGNAMAFIIAPNPGGERTAEAFEGDAAAAPLLHIEYIASSGPPPAAAAKFSSINRSGANIALAWTGTGTLQSAEAVTGPWTDVANAASPFNVTLSGAAKFFRFKP